jgi:serine/threonine-protein kinase RsbT
VTAVSERGGARAEPPDIRENQLIRADEDVVRVRQLVRRMAVAARLSLVDQTKLVTAASELARNTLVYGGGGEASVEIVDNGRRTGVRVTFADSGPGIPDVDLAMSDGYTTGGGLGLGLGGARRLVDEFDLRTAVPGGTRVTVTKWAG